MFLSSRPQYSALEKDDSETADSVVWRRPHYQWKDALLVLFFASTLLLSVFTFHDRYTRHESEQSYGKPLHA